MSKISENFRRLSRRLSNIPQIIFTAATSQPSTGSNNMQNDLHPNSHQQQPNQSNNSRILLNPSNLLYRLASASSQPRQFSIAPKPLFTDNFSIDDATNEPESNFVDDDPIIHMKNANEEVNERTIQFLSITYAILLIISGAMCTFFNVSHPKNSPRDIFVIIISLVGFVWVAFFHYDITKYRKWALKKVKQQQKDFYRRSRTTIEDTNDDNHDNHNHNEISRIQINDQDQDEDLDLQGLPAYDSVSLNTAAIFDYFDQNNDSEEPSQASSSPSLAVQIDQNHNEENDQESFIRFRTKPIRPQKAAPQKKKKKTRAEKNNVVAYRYFRGKHANDFYLKTGMIVFCFGSILHIGIDIVKQFYYYLHEDHYCQNPSLICMEIIRFIFSFYQLYVIFKYSNIIINRYKNLARFALMHLVGTAISCWLDTIVDEAINDYIEEKLCFDLNNMNYSICQNISISSSEDYHGLNDHIKFAENCSKSAIINSSALNALPYLYPFTIEFNIILASIWYMFWSNIGKIKDKSLFTESYENRMWHKYRLVNLSSNNTGNDCNSSIGGGDNRSYLSRRSSLLLTVDCHASNKGLFLGLAILLIILITIIIFFSTIHKHVSNQFGVVIYTLQILLLTFSCFFFIPIAHKRMRKLDVVKHEHRNNAFMMMEDILILIPIPFYFIHYIISAVASILISETSDGNNLVLIGIDILTIVQVLIQSPFIVDNLRRCSNGPEQRQQKPGRELVTLILILNVTLWILNTLELKSVEVYHASHKYFGEFFSMILSHTTLPMMLFYRFHSSVCLSHIWKYAYEKDE